MKKYLVYIITLLILSTSLINATNGVETIATKYAYNVEKNDTNQCCKTFSIIKYNGCIAYCIQPFVKVSNTANYFSSNLNAYSKIGNPTQAKIELVVKYGYDYPGHDTVQYYMAAQKLIWSYLGYNTTFYQDNAYDKKYSVTKYVNEILRLADNDSKYPTIESSYELKTNQEMTIEDYNNVLPDFTLAHSDNLEASIVDNKLIVKLLDYKPATLKLIRGKPESSSKTLEVITNSSAQNLVISPEEGYKSDLLTVSLKPNDLGSLCIIKKDKETKETITKKETSFKLIKDNGEVFKDDNGSSIFSTNKEGTLTINNLPFGDYEIQEIKAPQGYLLENKKVSITINSEKLITVDFYNQPIKGQILVHKTQQDNKDIDVANARYQLVDDQGTIYGDEYTDSNGEIIFKDLPLGVYSLEEVEAPKGYEIDPDFHTITLSSKDSSKAIVYSNIEVNDAKTPLICTVYKEMEESLFIDEKEGLSQTEITLYDSNNDPLKTYCFNEQNYIEISLPIEGTYTISETKAHPNYYINFESYKITASNSLVSPSTITIKNDLLRYNFKVNKKDSQNKKGLADAKFSLFADSSLKKLVSTGQSDKKGHVVFERLELGTYYLKEDSSPDNYSRSTDIVKIVVTDDNEVNTITVYNDPIVNTGSSSFKPIYLLGLLVIPLIIIIKVIM